MFLIRFTIRICVWGTLPNGEAKVIAYAIMHKITDLMAITYVCINATVSESVSSSFTLSMLGKISADDNLKQLFLFFQKMCKISISRLLVCQ